jgi:hypothetical protein
VLLDSASGYELMNDDRSGVGWSLFRRKLKK